MGKRVEKAKEKTEKGNAGVEEQLSKTAGLNVQDRCPVQNIDDYQCSGSLEIDFPELCGLLGMGEIPSVTIRHPASVSPTIDRGNIEDSQSQMGAGLATTTWCPKPCLVVELENEDPCSVKEVRIFGWKVDELKARVLKKTLPSLSHLQNLHLWRAGLTEQSLISIRNTISLCSNLRNVVLEGNPIPEQSYHLLLSEDSVLTHLSLRNNRIGEEGARLIGSALSTSNSANKTLFHLNLAFNSIGDAGAVHIAQGLRLNRSLLCLSLANNQIGDSGAARLAEVLGPFALSHEEIVERRKLLLTRDQSPSQAVSADSKCDRPLSIPSSSSLERNVSKGTKSASRKKDTPKKDEKPAANQAGAAAGKKEELKLSKKGNVFSYYNCFKCYTAVFIMSVLIFYVRFVLSVRHQGAQRNNLLRYMPLDLLSRCSRKLIALSVFVQDKSNGTQNKSAELVEIVSPLLEAGVQHAGGQVILPGNTALTSLNLAGNRLTEKSLLLFLPSLVAQGEAGGLLRLCLNRNRFPQDCEAFHKIQEIMSHRDPLNKTAISQPEEDQGQAA
ncbi:leucine-rich repeat-containing protein 71 isoform X2 [Osmerus eperlanus]|uniref:leucine-rich repeat-containing protein 71 isoform X2 n=1 Tax=Osmerus eperlanus TaxID=29151 RepID=UPI002E1482ED